MKRAGIVALCIVLAASAGCLGLLDDPESGDQIGPSEINQSVADSHADRLADANTFTVNGTFELSTVADFTLRANLNDRTSASTLSTENTEQVTFTNSSGTYIKYTTPEETQYNAVEEGSKFDASDATMRELIPVNATYERIGTTTIDGTEVATYRATGVPEDATLLAGSIEGSEVQNFSATLHVTDDGLVKHADWSAETGGGPVGVEVTFSELGTTEVSKPGWVSRTTLPTAAPQASFDFGYSADAGKATLTHTGGDEIAGERVRIIVEHDGHTHQHRWEQETISSGDSTAFSAESGATVKLVWSNGDRPVPLGEFEVPE